MQSSDPIDDIDVGTLGFQIRYRYELAPLSYLYVVYGRGGFDQETTDEGARGLLRDSFELRDDEQLLVKFRLPVRELALAPYIEVCAARAEIQQLVDM